MKRVLIGLLAALATALSLGGVAAAAPPQQTAPQAVAQVGAAVAAPVQQVAQQARACRSIDWLDNRVPAPWMTWVSAFSGYRNGHFWTSNNCADVFQFNSAGVSFEPNACVQVRLVFYNSSHNFDYQTGWATTCGLLLLALPDHRVEFSFDCRDNSASRRMRGSFCRYYYARF